MNKFLITLTSLSFFNIAYAINFETTNPIKTIDVEIVKSDNLSPLAGYDKNGNVRIFLSSSPDGPGSPRDLYTYVVLGSDQTLLYSSETYELSEKEYREATSYINSTNNGCKVFLSLNAKTYKLESLKQHCSKL